MRPTYSHSSARTKMARCNCNEDHPTEPCSVWKARGWKTAKGGDVMNRDLWEELDWLKAKHAIEWHWVRGHADDRDNIRCDSLANRAALEQISGTLIIPR